MDKRYAMLIEALAGTAKDLRRLVKPLDDAASLWRPAANEWCVRDVIAHLIDIEPQFLARMQRIVEQDNPHEPYIHPNPASHDLTQTCTALIAAFDARRVLTTQFLGTLTQAQWLRTCTHDTFGETRLRKQAEILIGHDNEHLAQLVSLREQIDAMRSSRPVNG
jgi:uncharacterized damage-inducible protein DinB